jgi:hypothetical protein
MQFALFYGTEEVYERPFDVFSSQGSIATTSYNL